MSSATCAQQIQTVVVEADFADQSSPQLKQISYGSVNLAPRESCVAVQAEAESGCPDQPDRTAEAVLQSNRPTASDDSHDDVTSTTQPSSVKYSPDESALSYQGANSEENCEYRVHEQPGFESQQIESPMCPFQQVHKPHKERQDETTNKHNTYRNGSKKQSQSSRNGNAPVGSRPLGVNKVVRPLDQASKRTQASFNGNHSHLEPSAEELLYLVMRRTRLQRESEKQLRIRHEELRMRNEDLKNEIQEQQTALKDSTVREQEQTTAFESCQLKLKSYIHRFDLLKDWCKGMSKEMKDLKAGADRARLDYQATESTRKNIASEMTILQGDSNKTNGELSTIKAALASAISKIQPLERDFQNVTQELERKTIRVLDLERTNTLLEDRLAVHQGEKNVNEIIGQQHNVLLQKMEHLQATFHNMSQDLKSTSAQSPVVEECLELLEALGSRTQLHSNGLSHIEETGSLLKQK